MAIARGMVNATYGPDDDDAMKMLDEMLERVGDRAVKRAERC